MQQGFYLLGDRMRERDAAGVFPQQGLEVVGEKVGIDKEQLSVFLLPLMAVGLYPLPPMGRAWCGVFAVGFEVGSFVEEDPEEEVGIEVAVDGNLMEIVVRCGAAIIAEFGATLEGDVEVDFVAKEVVVDPIHRRDRVIHSLTVVHHLIRREVVTEYPTVFFLWCQNSGQLQLLRLCLCIFTPLLQAVQVTPARSKRTMSRSIVFLFIFAITEKVANYYFFVGKLCKLSDFFNFKFPIFIFIRIFAFYFGFNMKGVKILCVVILLVLCGHNAQGQVMDSVDVLDYDISVDLTAGKPFHGEAVVTMKLQRPCESISLQLAGIADSVEVNGTRLTFSTLSALPTTGIAVGQPFNVHVWYHCNGYVESGGWGGMHFDNDMSYNLGVGFDTDPHVMGRAFFPCRDNFTDKATYTLRVKAKVGWTAECGGMLQSRILNADSTESSVWRIEQQTPTYLVSVSQAAWKRIYDSIPSLYGTYPATYGYLRPDSAIVCRVFAELDSVVPMYERCFGPYRWGRIGYIATNKGSMEHVNNIGLAKQAIISVSESGQSTIAHELGHAWFGNLVTCETESDMWINEGGASFTSEVAMEAVKGREVSDDYYQRHLEKVLRTTHVTDGGYRSLSPMPHDYTYGSTTYNKGWMVWHSLRGYLGEEVFYSAIQRLMNSCAFGNIDSYRLRDSLSLYTGVDLTDFFNFHVFSPGFVDYHVELDETGCLLNEVGVSVRQQSVATENSLHSHRVPITFFAEPGFDSTICKRVIEFEGNEGYAVVHLPFSPAFCVLDYDCEFSDAATIGVLDLFDYVGLQTLPIEHLKVRMDRTIQPQKLYAEHHMAPAMGEMPSGVVRRSNRYWMLHGTWNRNDSLIGYFRFVRGSASSSSYPYLDRGFYTKAATADSLGLFYRANSNDSWHLISRHREGDANEGWLVAEKFLPGEYTIAVVDFENLAIDNSEFKIRSSELNLFPNPLGKGQPLTIEIDTEMPFSVTIVDTEGRMVWHRDGCLNGQSLNPQLPTGTYIVTIENKQISLKSKLIQL